MTTINRQFTEENVTEFIRNSHGQRFACTELSKEFGCNIKIMAEMLAELVDKRSIEMSQVKRHKTYFIRTKLDQETIVRIHEPKHPKPFNPNSRAWETVYSRVAEARAIPSLHVPEGNV
jgi:hypothetical protein